MPAACRSQLLSKWRSTKLRYSGWGRLIAMLGSSWWWLKTLARVGAMSCARWAGRLLSGCWWHIAVRRTVQYGQRRCTLRQLFVLFSLLLPTVASRTLCAGAKLSRSHIAQNGSYLFCLPSLSRLSVAVCLSRSFGRSLHNPLRHSLTDSSAPRRKAFPYRSTLTNTPQHHPTIPYDTVASTCCSCCVPAAACRCLLPPLSSVG